MSRLVVHYDPAQRSSYGSEALRDRQAAVFERAAPSIALLAGSRPPNAANATAVLSARNSQKKRQNATNFDRVNREFLRVQQAKNRQSLNSSIRCIGREVKDEVVLREQNSQAARPMAVEELALPSPRRARDGTQAQRFQVADTSAVHLDASIMSSSGKPGDDPLQRSGVVPSYIEKAKDEGRMRGGERVALKQLAIAEAEFPPGTEPLSPARTDRSREFFEAQVAELTQKLHDFSFRQGQTLLGQKRKEQLEQLLRQAEQQLLVFQYPVVFVQASRPVLAPGAKQPSSWR